MTGGKRPRSDKASAAERERARLEEYVAISGAMIVALDARGRVAYVNPRACKRLGYDGPDDLLGRDWFATCVPPDTRDAVRAGFDALMRGDLESYGRFENEVLTRDGRRRTVVWSNTLVREPDGRISGTLSSGLDVTEQRRAEAALAERERAWATLVANLPGVVYRCHVEPPFDTVFVSERIRELTGHAPDDFTSGRVGYMDLVDPADAERVAPEVARALAAGRPFRITYRLRPRNGPERWVWEQGVGVPEPDGTVRFIEGFLAEITDQQRAEESARLLEAKLAHADRLATMGEMAARLAHELGQPLFAVNTHAQAMRRRVADGTGADQLADDLEQVSSQAERAQAILRSMRDFTRPDSGARERADLNRVVAEALHLAQPEARHHRARIRFEPHEERLPVRVNRVQIAQIVLNLVRNGLEAAAEAGDEPRVVVATRHDGGAEVEVHVTDRGPGLPEQSEHRLFEPFFSTKPGGMGLGLAICNTLATAHDGRIEALPGNGGGTTFRFVLPLEPEAEGADD